MEKVAKQSTQSGRKNHYFLILPVMSLWKPNKTGYERRRELQKSLNPARFHLHPQGKKKQSETIQNVSELCLMMICLIRSEGWGGSCSSQSPFFFFCICRLQKACFQCRACYQEETIKGKERAFKLGPFDCVTDCFQVRQLWEPQPGENCPSVQHSWEAGRLHGWHGAPEFQYYSRLLGFLWDLTGPPESCCGWLQLH